MRRQVPGLTRGSPTITVGSATFSSSAPSLRSYLRRRCYATQADGESSTISKKKAYRSTLNLPKTSFDIRSRPEISEKLYKSRTCESLYHWQRENNTGSRFVLHDGPPYANGDLHMGHALNKILKDIINRFQVLQGRKVHFVPGWDCHGLPIEAKAVFHLTSSGEFEGRHLREIPPIEIRKAAREEATKSIEAQRAQFQEFGIMADWSEEGTYRTFDRSYEMRQLKIFGELARRGLIYRANKPVYWSPSSRTALAEAELEYEDKHVSSSVFVRFPLADEDQGGIGEGLRAAFSPSQEATALLRARNRIDLVVWTTTPWTLPSNMAVAINPEMTYCLVRVQRDNSLVIVAAERVAKLENLKVGLSGPKGIDKERETWGPVQEIVSFPGSSLLDSRYRHLFLPSSISSRPILPASWVTSTSGTSLVHVAPAHGSDDYELFRSHGLLSKDSEVLISPVDDDGNYGKEVRGLGADAVKSEMVNLVGEPVLGEGGKMINKILMDHDALISEVRLNHRYPYDWRTKLPVITRIKSDASQALSSVSFTPSTSRSRLESFVKSRSEWCISRQRAWGVPIPVIYDASTDEALLSENNIAHVIKVLQERGTDHWWIGEAEEFVAPIHKEGNQEKKWRKGTDTVDVWFDSGTSWSMLEDLTRSETTKISNEPSRPLADVYFEGTDQHRGWFQSSLLTKIATSSTSSSPSSRDSISSSDQQAPKSGSISTSTHPIAPFSNLLTHGFVVDKEGRKMAKSLGNGIDPLLIIKGGKDRNINPAFGADVLRLWAARADYTGDTPIGPLIIKNTADSLRKLRNTARFMLGNLPRPEEVPELISQKLSLPDRFLLHELYELEKGCKAAYSSFDFAQVARRLSEFANSTLSTLWFDISKDTLYSDPPQSEARRACIAVLDQTLRTFTSILAPILPHLAEEIEHHRRESADDHLSIIAESNSHSVFHNGWQSVDARWQDEEISAEVKTLLKIRDEVLVMLESVRQIKRLKSAIEAGIDIYLKSPEGEDQAAKTLLKYQDQLSKLLIVSDVRIFKHPIPPSQENESRNADQPWPALSSRSSGFENVEIAVRPALGQQCPRCWIHQSTAENQLCGRCESAVQILGSS